MIRQAKSNDFESILKIEKNSAHPFYEKYPQRKKGIAKWLKRRFSKKDNEFYVYVDEDNISNPDNNNNDDFQNSDDKIIAYVAFKKNFSAPDSCEIICLSVLKEKQNQGIGRKMTKFIEMRAKELNFKRIFLYTGKENVNAQHFYEKLNYKKINEFPDFYGCGDTAILYGKLLKD